MNYLIIGGSSFIGVYTVKELLSRGANVVTTGRNPKFASYYKGLGVTYLPLDITDREAFQVLGDNTFDGVVSFAARMPSNVMKDAAAEDIDEYIKANVLGTIYILDWCRAHQVNRLVDFVSQFDCKLYGPDTIITEETPYKFSYTDDHAAYVVSKNQKAEIMTYYNERYGMKNIWLRTPTVYGVGPHGSFAKDGIVKKSGLQLFVEKAMAGERIVIYGEPDTRKDVLYVKDMAIAAADALESREGKGLYNAAYDENYPFFTLALATAEAFGTPGHISEVISDPSIPNNGGMPKMSNEKIKRELGFSPKYSDPYVMMRDYRDELERGVYAELFS